MKRVFFLSVCFLFVIFGRASAQNPVTRLAPLIDQYTIAVGHLDLNKVDVAAVMKTVGEITGAKPDEIAKVEPQVQKAVKVLRLNGIEHVYIVASLEDISPEPVFLAFSVNKNADVDMNKLADMVKAISKMQDVRPLRGFIVAGQSRLLDRVAQRKASPNPQLVKAFDGLEKYDAQFAVVLPANPLRKALMEVFPRLPEALGGGPIGPVLNGFRSVTGGVRFKSKAMAEVTINASNAKAVTHLHKLFKAAMNALAKEARQPEDKQLVAALQQVLKPKLTKNQLIWSVTLEKLAPVLLPLVAKARAAARGTQSQNNLKQIGLALHSYHDVNKAFPAMANYDKNGKPLLSWRVHILPYIEQDVLYRQFKLNEPWDSPHNKKLIAQMPPTLRNPSSKAGLGKTVYLAPVGKGTLFGKRPVKIQTIRDGTSNTIMVVEADDDKAVIWTKPEDLPIDAKNPLLGLGNNAMKTFYALFADGSVRRFSRDMNPANLNAMFTKGGGEVVNP